MCAKKELSFILLVLFLLGCTQPYDSKNSGDLAFLDIVDAQQLFIGTKAVSKSTKSASDRLFKITDDGFVEEVRHIDNEGNEITDLLDPVSVYDVNETYIIVCFGHDLNWIESGYLVRKSDGAVFSLGDEGFPEQFELYDNSKRVATDKYGNIYYRACLRGELGDYSVLLKINTANPEDLTREVYSAPTDAVGGFLVDSEGNAIYSGSPRDDPSVGIPVRLRKASGGLFNLSWYWTGYWIGLDGCAYRFMGTMDESGNPGAIIQRITVDESSNVIISDYGEIAHWFPGLSFKLSLQDRIIIIHVAVDVQFEVYNPTATPRVISTLPGFETIKAAVASSSYYYIGGYDNNQYSVIIRVDPTDDSYTYLLNSGELEIDKMSVSDSDVLTFSALRFVDGKKVIYEIDVDEVLTVLDEELDVTIVSLERIR